MLKKLKDKLEKIQLTKNTHVEVNREENMVNFVKNVETKGTDNVELVELFSEQMDVPVFKGTVEHAYESDFLGHTNECPRCQSPTEKKISNFAYATQAKSRLMTGPAGFFCPNCPTVIIDDDMVRLAIRGPHHYYGVFTIETGYSDEPILFKTLNGEKTIYIFDEDGGSAGIVQSVHKQDNAAYIDPLTHLRLKQLATKKQQRKKSTNKRKNKAAKNARRKNRKNRKR